MIAFVSGVLEDITNTNAVIDVGGVGLNVAVSAQTAIRMGNIGEEVKLYTYTCVREDQFSLYGFLTRDELSLFKILITVSGIGPKGGLSILSAMSADDLRFAIASGDAKAIAAAPGVGKKTAERVIIDLHDKIALPAYGEASDVAVASKNPQANHLSSAETEAIEALCTLGYLRVEASKAVHEACAQEPNLDTEQLLKAALKFML